MKRHADVIILCEDRAHTNFIRHYLKKRGFNNRKIRIMPRCSPASGAQFVEANYATAYENALVLSAGWPVANRPISPISSSCSP